MKFSKILHIFSAFLRLCFPSNKAENILFLIVYVFYFPLGMYLALNTGVIVPKNIPWDLYFSFDNRSIAISGGMVQKHPFAEYIIVPIYSFGLMLSSWFHDNRWVSIVFVIICNLFVSLSIVQIFKYLRNILNLNLKVSALLIVFYSIFTTNILLSFTPETYVFTVFLLSFYNYLTVYVMKKGRKISTFFVSSFGVLIGGMTITNLSKVFIPILFENKKFNLKNICFSIRKGIVAVVVFIVLYLWRSNWDYMNIITKSSSQYEKFSNPKGTTWFDMVFSYFFGGNMLFPSFVERDLDNLFLKLKYKALYFDIYHNFSQYIFVGLVFIFMIWALIKNKKNIFVYFLWISFFFDIIIHCFMKFGLRISYIYGGHWVFVVPLLIGWLLHSYKDNKKIYNSIVGILGMMTIYIIINNSFRMVQFIDFVNKYYLLK